MPGAPSRHLHLIYIPPFSDGRWVKLSPYSVALRHFPGSRVLGPAAQRHAAIPECRAARGYFRAVYARRYPRFGLPGTKLEREVHAAVRWLIGKAIRVGDKNDG